MYQAAVIGLSSLEALAISHILETFDNIESESFQDFGIFAPMSERYAIYVVSSDVFAANLDFFLPKKGRYLVVTANGDGKETMVGRNDDISIITERLGLLVGALDCVAEGGGLSVREMEVLRVLVSGKTVKEIADDLCISPNTVITHRKNISSKLGIKSISGLSLYALMNGII